MYNTRGIALQTIKYSDSSLIAKFYTAEFGIQSYLVRGIRSKSSKVKASTIQHMNLFDMQVTHKEKTNLHSIKELINNPIYNSIPLDIVKSSLVLFLNEIVIKTIKEEEPNLQLFNFLEEFLQNLDRKEKNFVDDHLFFMIYLSNHLGFYPSTENMERAITFDLQEGVFLQTNYYSPLRLNAEETELLKSLLKSVNGELELQLKSSERKKLLWIMLRYFECHVETFKNIQTVHVLEEIFQ